MVQDVRSSVYSSSVDQYIKEKGSLFITCALCNKETYFNHLSEIKKSLLISQLLDLEKAQSKSNSFLCKSRTSSSISNISRMSNNEFIFDHSVNDKHFLNEHETFVEAQCGGDAQCPKITFDAESQLNESHTLADSLNDISFVFEKYANKETYFRKIFDSLDSDKDTYVKVADIKRLLNGDFQYEKYSQNDDHSSIHNEMELLKDSDLVNFETFIRILMYVLKSELKLKSQDLLDILDRKSDNMDTYKSSSKDRQLKRTMRRKSFSTFNSSSYKEAMPDVVEL